MDAELGGVIMGKKERCGIECQLWQATGNNNEGFCNATGLSMQSGNSCIISDYVEPQEAIVEEKQQEEKPMEEYYKGEKIHDYICNEDCPYFQSSKDDKFSGTCNYNGEKRIRGAECICPETAVTREPADCQFDGFEEPEEKIGFVDDEEPHDISDSEDDASDK